MVGDHYQYKLQQGPSNSIELNVTNASNNYTMDELLFTFWAFDFDYPGTTEYFLYNTTTNPFGVPNSLTRYTLSRYKQSEGEDGIEWNLAFSFWAFEDESITKFLGNLNHCLVFKMH